MILSSFWHIFGSAEEASAFFFTMAYIFLACSSITIGFYCMILMKKKGYRTPALWFILGLFLSFIGLIICLRKKEIHYTTVTFPQSFDQYYSQPLENVRCEQCGAQNPQGSAYCNTCGQYIDHYQR